MHLFKQSAFILLNEGNSNRILSLFMYAILHKLIVFYLYIVFVK